MLPKQAPYTSEQVKNEISRIRRHNAAVAVVLIIVAILACAAAFAASMGVLG